LDWSGFELTTGDQAASEATATALNSPQGDEENHGSEEESGDEREGNDEKKSNDEKESSGEEGSSDVKSTPLQSKKITVF